VDTIYFDLAKAFDKVPHQCPATDVKVEGTRHRRFSGKLDKVMVVRQMAEYVWMVHFRAGQGLVWCSPGSVLGPVLFLIFINDLDNAIFSNVLKFADDTKVYKVVDNQFDGAQLQSDLDSLGDWAVKWQMKFNVEKCKVVHYGKRSIDVEYSLYGQPLEEVVSEKDLGVVFSNDLKVRRQCEEAYS